MQNEKSETYEKHMLYNPTYTKFWKKNPLMYNDKL